MARGKQRACCGYLSQREAVLALKARGLCNVEIAARVHRRADEVGSILSQARRARPSATVGFRVPRELALRFVAAAEARGMSVHDLLYALVEAIAEDVEVLPDAILDDDVAHHH